MSDVIIGGRPFNADKSRLARSSADASPDGGHSHDASISVHEGRNTPPTWVGRHTHPSPVVDRADASHATRFQHATISVERSHRPAEVLQQRMREDGVEEPSANGRAKLLATWKCTVETPCSHPSTRARSTTRGSISMPTTSPGATVCARPMKSCQGRSRSLKTTCRIANGGG